MSPRVLALALVACAACASTPAAPDTAPDTAPAPSSDDKTPPPAPSFDPEIIARAKLGSGVFEGSVRGVATWPGPGLSPVTHAALTARARAETAKILDVWGTSLTRWFGCAVVDHCEPTPEMKVYLDALERGRAKLSESLKTRDAAIAFDPAARAWCAVLEVTRSEIEAVYLAQAVNQKMRDAMKRDVQRSLDDLAAEQSKRAP